MSPCELSEHEPESPASRPPIHCDDCAAALESQGWETVSYLLFDHLTVPIIGCDGHLDQFAEQCGYTTEDTPRIIPHRPAGGIVCPGCRLAPHNPPHPVLPVGDGVVIVPACPRHQSAIVDRFYTGGDLQHQLTSSLDIA